MTPKELAGFYQAITDGGEGQYDFLSKGWDMVKKGPNLASIKADFRIKPKLKAIDMRILVGSGILCEFANISDDDWYAYKLTDISRDGYFAERDGKHSKHGNRCRVMQDYWHNWQGGECPLPDGLIVELQLRNCKSTVKIITPSLRWEHIGYEENSDIIEFKVTGIAEGWTYEYPSKNRHDKQSGTYI